MEPGMDRVVHIKAGEYEFGQMFDSKNCDVEIPWFCLDELIAFLDEKHLIKPKMDNASRGEDLKIIHRLLDIQTKIVETGGIKGE